MYRIKIKKSVICKVNIVIDLSLPETDVLSSSDPEGKTPIQGLVDSINKPL